MLYTCMLDGHIKSTGCQAGEMCFHGVCITIGNISLHSSTRGWYVPSGSLLWQLVSAPYDCYNRCSDQLSPSSLHEYRVSLHQGRTRKSPLQVVLSLLARVILSTSSTNAWFVWACGVHRNIFRILSFSFFVSLSHDLISVSWLHLPLTIYILSLVTVALFVYSQCIHFTPDWHVEKYFYVQLNTCSVNMEPVFQSDLASLRYAL